MAYVIILDKRRTTAMTTPATPRYNHPKKKVFKLPMVAALNISQQPNASSRFIAHALDFDLVCSASTKERALEKIRLAVKTYIEYGLSKNWAEDIHFPAPADFWEKFQSAGTVELLPPILIEDDRLLVVMHEYPKAA